MIKKILIAIAIYLALYYLKVPMVVTFTDQLLVSFIPLWDSFIDSWIHLMERHPYIYMTLPILLFYLMLPKKDTQTYKMFVMEDD